MEDEAVSLLLDPKAHVGVLVVAPPVLLAKPDQLAASYKAGPRQRIDFYRRFILPRGPTDVDVVGQMVLLEEHLPVVLNPTIRVEET
jgi:hypothetical protein